MAKLIPLNKLFKTIYGVNLELVNVEECNKTDLDSIRFVSRSERNNGVSAYVKKIEEIKPNPGHTISVATSGSVLSAFYQPEEYYSGRDLYYLQPKREMGIGEMLFYAFCIRANKYKYNYGRAANRTLGEILIPSIVPKEFKEVASEKLYVPSNKSTVNSLIKLNTLKWKTFKYGGKKGIFEIKNGYYNKKPDHIEEGNIPFIGASEFNNGVTEYYSLYDIENCNRDEKGAAQPIDDKIFAGNCITVANDGASVGFAFYQDRPFTGSHSINILRLKEYKLNKYLALFLCTLIHLEKYRWAYGRKWRPSRMPDSVIKLPVSKNGKPDWEWMENYIKSLPYSASI